MLTKPKLLIFGGSGLVGTRAKDLLVKNFEIIAPDHKVVNLEDFNTVNKFINKIKPKQILYTAGFTKYDEAPLKAKEAMILNSGSVLFITHIAAKLKIPFHYLSTEIVFDGTKKKPYKETDLPNPQSYIGITKRLGELATLNSSKNNSVLRLIICYSPFFSKKTDLARLVVDKLRKEETITITDNQEINPIYVDHLISAIETVMVKHASGIYHLGATDYITPYIFANKIAKIFNLNSSLIKKVSFEIFSKTRPEPRPQHEWLDIGKFTKDFGKGILKSTDEGINEFFNNYK